VCRFCSIANFRRSLVWLFDSKLDDAVEILVTTSDCLVLLVNGHWWLRVCKLTSVKSLPSSSTCAFTCPLVCRLVVFGPFRQWPMFRATWMTVLTWRAWCGDLHWCKLYEVVVDSAQNVSLDETIHNTRTVCRLKKSSLLGFSMRIGSVTYAFRQKADIIGRAD
jgi:hypothetical protein